PLSSNYRAAINGKPKPETGATTFTGKGTDWFWVLRSYPDGEHEAFISLPDETVVMMSDLPTAALKDARTLDKFVALEKPHRTFTIHYEGGHATYHYAHSD